jgi:hypothetical protein
MNIEELLQRYDPALQAMMRRFDEQIQASEVQRRWTRIGWRSEANTALADARAADKPILVFFRVGAAAQPKADQC